MTGPGIFDELQKRLSAGYNVDGRPVNVEEFEPEDEAEREFLRVMFHLGGKRFPSFTFTFDREASVEANLSQLDSFVRSHAAQAATLPVATHRSQG